MKIWKWAWFIGAVLILTGSANAQYAAIGVGRSYAATDTTATVSPQPGNCVLAIWFKDSVNVQIDADFKIPNSTLWKSYRVSDSTNSVVAAGCYLTYTLRYGGTNNIPGGTELRLRITRAAGLTAGKNGTSTPTYSSWLLRD